MLTGLSLVCIALVLTSCEDEPTGPNNSATSVTKANMRPDSATGWMYYSIDGDSIVPADQANTTNWDIRFAYLLCCGKTQQIDVFLNSGTAGPGNVKGDMVNVRFENLIDVPDTTTLVVDDTSKAGRIVPVPVVGPNIMFVYDVASHTIQCSPDQVLVIKTGKGAMAKFQFTSIYENAPSAPTMFTNIGFYHFRYVKTTTGEWVNKPLY